MLEVAYYAHNNASIMWKSLYSSGTLGPFTPVDPIILCELHGGFALQCFHYYENGFVYNYEQKIIFITID